MTARLRDRMVWPDQVRYLAWRVIGQRPLTVRLKTGERVVLRKPPATDLDTANELFVQQCYRSPRPFASDAVRQVIDLGANVGYSVVHWLRQFPEARVVAFEPHPAHCRQIRRHLQLNGGVGRVTLVEAAAGTAAGAAILTDEENRSSLIGAAEGLTVPVVDLFATVGGEPIDLLKMDIEGAEYPLLADPRFADLRPRVVVLEWHTIPALASGPEWCERRFAEYGYGTTRTWDAGDHGILWAFAES